MHNRTWDLKLCKHAANSLNSTDTEPRKVPAANWRVLTVSVEEEKNTNVPLLLLDFSPRTKIPLFQFSETSPQSASFRFLTEDLIINIKAKLELPILSSLTTVNAKSPRGKAKHCSPRQQLLNKIYNHRSPFSLYWRIIRACVRYLSRQCNYVTVHYGQQTRRN